MKIEWMNYLISLMFILPFVGVSQITLTAADFANAGDTVRMSTTTDLGIDFSTTGANQVWDYSSLIAESQYLIEYRDLSTTSAFVNFMFGAFAPIDYRATYFIPNDDLPLDQVGAFLPVTIDDLFQYSKKSNDSITSIGFSLNVSGVEAPFKSDTIETRYKYPLTYTDSYSSRGYTKMDLNPIYDAVWLQYRERSCEVDGWGTVTTPFGVYNALRIHHVINETDSIRVDLFGTGTPAWIPLTLPISHIYEWWANNEKDAVMRIETTEVGGTETVSLVEYRDAFKVGISEFELQVNIYPNPVTDKLLISDLNNPSIYSIYNSNGEVVLKGKTKNEINVHHLAKGVYQLHLNLNGRNTVKTFVKK